LFSLTKGRKLNTKIGVPNTQTVKALPNDKLNLNITKRFLQKIGVINTQNIYLQKTFVKLNTKAKHILLIILFSLQVKAIVEKVGINFRVEVPLSGEKTTAGSFEFDPPLDDLPVDVDMKLDELGELEPIIKPLVINPVKKKIIEILKGEVKELIDKKIQQFIPGVNSLT